MHSSQRRPLFLPFSLESHGCRVSSSALTSSR